MMLLIGMWMSLTKKPMKPMMQKPIAVAIAIFWNSEIKRKHSSINFYLLFVTNKIIMISKLNTVS